VGVTVPPMTPDVPAFVNPNEFDETVPVFVIIITLSNKGILLL
jgi:hypothetical protein